MNPNQLKQLEKLAKVFNTSNIISPEDIQEVLKGIALLLADYRKGTVELTEDVKKTFEDVINTISNEHDKILKEVKNTSETVKSEATEAVTKAISEMKRMCDEIMEMKPKDGENGEDADEEKIIEEVLAKIKLPEYKETVLDSGEQIVDKINALDISPENQIDASHIKNLPQPKMIGGGSTARNLYQLNDVNISSPTSNQVLKYNSTTNLWENGSGGGSSLTLQTDGVPNTDQTLLNLEAGTNVTLTDNLAGTVTIDVTASNISLETNGIVNNSQSTLNLIAGTNVTLTDDGLGGVTIDATGGGGGDVTKVGTPVNNQIGVWTGDGTIEGTTGFTYDGANLLLTGDIGATGTRITKGWFTDLQVTNSIAASITGSAATLTTTRTIWGQNFNGSANVTGTLALGTADLTMTGSIGATGARATKVWATDIESTNAPTVGGTAVLVSGGALGTPSSGTVTNLTGTASININGTVGATTPTTGVFTTLVAGSTTSLLLGTAGSAVGNIGFRNATSGTITLAPATGALGTVTLTMPAITDTLATLAGTETFSNKTLTAPKFADLGFIADANGNEMIIFDTVASAVNEVTLANAATGANPKLSATGGDTNIGIDLQTKGTGVVNILGNSTQAGEVRIFEDTDNGTNYTGFKAPATLAGNVVYTLPTADGTSGQVLSTNASGVLSWATAGSAAFSGAFAYASSGQSITTTLTAVVFDSESYDTDSYHSTSSNTSRMTVPSTGYYRITGLVTTDANAAARAQLRVDGTTTISAVAVGNAAANYQNGALITRDVYLTSGQYVELMGAFGTTQTTVSGVSGASLSIQKIG